MVDLAWTVLAERHWLAGCQNDDGPDAALTRLHNLVYAEPEHVDPLRAQVETLLGI